MSSIRERNKELILRAASEEFAEKGFAASKTSVPLMAQNIIDRCMQMHGAGGLPLLFFCIHSCFH